MNFVIFKTKMWNPQMALFLSAQDDQKLADDEPKRNPLHLHLDSASKWKKIRRNLKNTQKQGEKMWSDCMIFDDELIKHGCLWQSSKELPQLIWQKVCWFSLDGFWSISFSLTLPLGGKFDSFAGNLQIAPLTWLRKHWNTAGGRKQRRKWLEESESYNWNPSSYVLAFIQTNLFLCICFFCFSFLLHLPSSCLLPIIKTKTSFFCVCPNEH